MTTPFVPIVVIIGAPGSGKSTLTDGLRMAFPQVYSFGARRYFSEQKQRRTPLGMSIMKYRQGQWLPDQTVIDAVRDAFLDGLFDSGVIFEGVPAKRRQAELFDDMVTELGRPLTGVVHVATPLEVCMERALARRVCQTCDFGSHQAVEAPEQPGHCVRCGDAIITRPNDNPKDMGLRLQEYSRLAPPLLDYYAGREDLLEVDGRRSAHDMLDRTLVWLGERILTPVTSQRTEES